MQKVDNLPMLQLDIVWCYFMLRDVSCLEVAGARLEKARLGFERSHGKDSTRFRLLQAGRQADLAMWDLFLLLPCYMFGVYHDYFHWGVNCLLKKFNNKKGSPMHVAPICAGSDHFRSFVCSLSLHLFKSWFQDLNPRPHGHKAATFPPCQGSPLKILMIYL